MLRVREVVSSMLHPIMPEPPEGTGMLHPIMPEPPEGTGIELAGQASHLKCSCNWT